MLQRKINNKYNGIFFKIRCYFLQKKTRGILFKGATIFDQRSYL